ncbi:portal protein [Bosea lupini]|uniref:portal protein n=1 Tax=Bosea lupini TaxID=1036779 RepID=UPI001430E8F4|nr:portal protein [Bosea lupini]
MAGQRARADAAHAVTTQWWSQWDEAYEFALPFRKPAESGSNGEKRADRLFDNTGLVSTFRFSERMQRDLVPVGQEWFQLEPSAFLKIDPDLKIEVDEYRLELQRISTLARECFSTGSWDTAFVEMALDLAMGTGAMLIMPGSEAHEPVAFIATSIRELALESGPFNKIDAIFWKKQRPAREIKAEMPDGTFPREFEDVLRDKPETKFTLSQDVVLDRSVKPHVWRYTAYLDKSERPIRTATYRTCPWIVPRYWRVPGETFGRGPIMVALPALKTLNKTQELTLRAAALAILGVYTQLDDGVFNPDTARLTPGALWKVARNGGVLGPSIQKLDVPGRFDVSNIVLADQRQQVQRAMLDDGLPPEQGGVRSALEIAERMKHLAANTIGAYARHVQEIIVPAVRRVIDILDTMKLLVTKLPMNQLLTQVKVTSPMAAAIKADMVKRQVEWVQMIAALGGPQATAQVVKLEQMMADMGHDLGIPAKYITTVDERQQLMLTTQKLVALALAAIAEQAKQGGGLPANQGAAPDAAVA